MRSLPPGLREELDEALVERVGSGGAVAGVTPLSGGSINDALRLETEAGDAFFLKWNAAAPEGMFDAEADGLAALATAARETGAELQVPEVVAVGQGGRPADWLLLEYVHRGSGGVAWGERLGRALAALHGSRGPVGWPRDNFIGSLPQTNRCSGRSAGGSDAPGSAPGRGTDGSARDTPHTWARFWAEARIEPQLRSARDLGYFRGRGGRVLEDLVACIPDALEGGVPEGASLLHGDLWGGNVFPDGRGCPVLVDPAVYRGHREVDLAMSELFGFPGGFLPAYREARPVDDAYDAHRRDLYQLYYLLVHVNLFGGGYEAGCVRAAERVLATA